MSDRGDTASRLAAYTFTKREGLLAHYTEASVAFEHVLPSRKLRLSPYHVMRDPAENKDVRPNICSLRPSPDDDLAINEVYALIKAERDRMRVLSLTRDADDRGDFPGYDCCWSRPRMWEQYAGKHGGACLLFDRPCLEALIREQWPAESTYLRELDYTREASEAVFKRGVNADHILDDDDPRRAVRDYIHRNRDAFFFLKSDDFATEYEYRVVVAAGDGDYAHIDYGHALVGVVLGERSSKREDPRAIEMCAEIGVKLGWMHWIHGRPRVLVGRL